MRRILFMAIAAYSMLACNKQEIVDSSNMENGNTLTLTLQQSTATKGVSDQKGDLEFSVIGSGKLYFIDAQGTSISQRELTDVEILALANTPTTAGGKTVTIIGIPNTATTLYFMSNIRTVAAPSYPAVDGINSADARLRIDKLQANATNVPMSGQSTTFIKVGNQYTASVELTPIVARLEIGQITCENQNGSAATAISADIVNYRLAGVFINNIRQSVLLSGTPYLIGSTLDIKAQLGWSSGWTNYFSSNTVFPYFAGGNPQAPSDWVANSMVTYCQSNIPVSKSFYPDSNNGATNITPTITPKQVWGYQICPSTTASVGSAPDLPHIILKLIDVSYVDNTLIGSVKYVTVTKYKDISNNSISEFKRGNVYRIQNLTFTHNEATNQPYEQNITVTATVTVKKWDINNITPDWN
ncbi:MAG: hypothetical protein RR407_03835 [Bacteroidales bacterium]